MNGVEKIGREHFERRAVVYARQSTMAQVLNHQTSTERQFALTKLAEQLGWKSTQVELISEDLGRSGKQTEGRDGFQRLAADVGLGKVGAIVSLDAASRLSRCSADWHRLLETAGLTRTLLIDEQSVYDPRDPNDRLLLGMKGTMADFELVWLRQRMDGGRWHLARKGEYRSRLAIGYVYDEKISMDPNEEIRRAVALLFERYRSAASCSDVVDYFNSHALRFPSRVCGGGLQWNRLRMVRVHELLHNPIYAGAYVFGRTKQETILVDGERRKRVQHIPMDQWPVLIKNAHSGYISWEEFMANQKRLSETAPIRKGGLARGAVREGAAMLQGLLLCGRCGNGMHVSYRGQSGRYPAYTCGRLKFERVAEQCLTISSRVVEEPVIEFILSTLTEANLQAAVEVMALVEQEDGELAKQWQLRIERAQFEAKRAQRQYDACEPENRVVARTLETRWNEKLAELEQIQLDYDRMRERKRTEISELDRERIMKLASDIKSVWNAAATTDRDRKCLLRQLVDKISVRSIDLPRKALRVRILWHSRAVSELELDRPGRGGRRPKISWSLVSTAAANGSV